jgi:hypothetical protein
VTVDPKKDPKRVLKGMENKSFEIDSDDDTEL